jgi:2'-5' RNA ligase
MLVHGAVLPPRAALEAVNEVVRAVPVPYDEPVAAAPKGLFGRLGRGKNESSEPSAEAPAMLEYPPLGRIQLPVTEFGNLTTNDARGLGDEIAGALQGFTTPTVHFAGGTALDFPGDWSVWAKLAGDVDELGAIAREVVHCVERLGLFVDRRIFRPMVPIATVTSATTGPYLEAVVNALEAFEGEDWPIALSLTKETFVGATTAWVEFQRVPFGS